MVKEMYNSLEVEKSLWDIVIRFISDATEDEIRKVLRNGIDEDIKKRMDVADLTYIKGDIDMYDNYCDYDSTPEMSGYTFELAEIDMFINSTEKRIGRRLNYDDFFKIPGLCDSIDMMQPIRIGKNIIDKEKKIKNIGFKKIITNIRNCLMHNRYILNTHGVYMHSDKGVGNQPFEAFISYDFFNKIIMFCEESDRKLILLGLRRDNNIVWGKGFDKNKHLISIETREATGKGDIYTSETEKLLAIKNTEKQFKNLSKGQEELLSEYFKTHEFNRRNLAFLSFILGNNGNWIQIQTTSQISQIDDYILGVRNALLNWVNNNGLLKGIMLRFVQGDNIREWKIWNTDKYIKKEVESLLINTKVFPYMIYYYYENPESKRYLSDINLRSLAELLPINLKESMNSIIMSFKDQLLAVKDFYLITRTVSRKSYLQSLYLSKFYVNNPKLELAQPQKRIGNKYWKQGRDYIMNRCKKNPKTYRSNEVKKAGMDKILGDFYRTYLFKQLTSGDVEDWIVTRDNNEIEDYINNNRDYLMFNTLNAKKLSPEQKEIVENNVRKVITEWKEKLDTITIIGEEEHIRNAFAHHHYTKIPGFNKILLWDPSIDDTPNRERVYDLDELYENAVSRVNEDYLDIKVTA